MNKIVDILMKRDGLNEEDARALMKETADEVMCNPMDGPDIIMDYLYLEPDYLEYLFIDE